MLAYDPVARAGQLWEQHWPNEDSVTYEAMRAVTSIMRAQQVLLADLDQALRPFGLTFSRYEALVLLSFARDGALSLSRIGQRLQVHATSVTNVIDRLEGAGLVERRPNPHDGRGVLATITEHGRSVAEQATRVLNQRRFGLAALPEQDLQALFRVLRRLRIDAGDFADDNAGPR